MNQEPSREDVAQAIDDLVAGRITREDASRWSVDHDLDDDPDPDRAEALELLMMVDLRDQPPRDGHIREEDYVFGFDGLIAARDVLRTDDPTPLQAPPAVPDND